MSAYDEAMNVAKIADQRTCILALERRVAALEAERDALAARVRELYAELGESESARANLRRAIGELPGRRVPRRGCSCRGCEDTRRGIELGLGELDGIPELPLRPR